MECVNLSAAPINSTWFCQNCDLANQIRARPTVSQLPPDSLPPHARVGNSPPHLRNSNSPIVTAEPSATGGELKEGEGCVII